MNTLLCVFTLSCSIGFGHIPAGAEPVPSFLSEWVLTPDIFGSSHQFSAIVTDGGGNWVASGQNGKIGYSTDNGKTWSLSANSESGFSGAFLHNAATDGGGLWIISADGSTIGSSTDNGNTWSVSAAGHLFFCIGCCGGGNWIATVEDDKIGSSSDDGATWVYASFPCGSGFTSIEPDGGGNWIAYSGSDIAYSSDNGASWSLSSNANSLFGSFGIITVSACGTGTWIAGAGNGIIAYSSDNGASWSLSKNSSDVFGASSYIITGAYNGVCVAVAYPFNTIGCSYDNGATWTKLDNNLSAVLGSSTITYIASDKQGGWLIAGTEGKILYSK